MTAQVSLDDIARDAVARSAPFFPSPPAARTGGVDPLGLRQINFDLMDELLVGFNNVAVHVRPSVVVAWAWRRAAAVAAANGLDELTEETGKDFVARIEVAFVWSHLIAGDLSSGGSIDLPGNQRLLKEFGQDQIVFGDEKWRAFAEARAASTALSAAINYGPGLRAFAWLSEPKKGIRKARSSANAALDALEARLQPRLGHDLFRTFDEVTLTRDEALNLRELWFVGSLTDEEKAAMRERMFGDLAPLKRRLGVGLLLSATNGASSAEALRERMCGQAAGHSLPAEIEAVAASWAAIQTRQAFRLALEALFHWIQGALAEHPLHSAALARRFIEEVGVEQSSAGAWVEELAIDAHPTGLQADLTQALARRSGVALGIARAVAHTLVASCPNARQRDDRLPIKRCQAEYASLRDRPVLELATQMIERWVLAQHVYWSVGRGLSDARSQSQKRIIRLKVMLEEAGWTLARSGGAGQPPRATPDRLSTTISLARECGLLLPEDRMQM